MAMSVTGLAQGAIPCLIVRHGLNGIGPFCACRPRWKHCAIRSFVHQTANAAGVGHQNRTSVGVGFSNDHWGAVGPRRQDKDMRLRQGSGQPIVVCWIILVEISQNGDVGV